jgi:hypothetical protein
MFGMMKMESSNKRRNFMMAFGLGAIGAVSAVLLGKRPAIAADKPETTAAEPEAVKGYHVSEHVKRYYRTTRV